MENDKILKVNNIYKRFVGVKAVNNVSMALLKGEVHALIGENGAGKSTLIKIICGVYGYDRGSIFYKGKKLPQGNPRIVQENGIFMIPQDLGLFPHLTVLQNIFLGREKRKLGIVNLRYSKYFSQKLLKDIGVNLDINAKVRELSPDQQQFVAIAKVLSAEAEIIIFDETTSTLSESEVRNLFNIIKKLKTNGITIIYISHRLEEIFQIADRVTVLKDGCLVKTTKIIDTSKDDLIKSMVGRTLSNTFPEKQKGKKKHCIMKLRNVSIPEKLNDINLDIFKGEILGIGGLVGMGQVSLVNMIFGSEKARIGSVYFGKQELRNLNPNKAINLGINFVSSDRKGEMLFMCRSVRENICIATLKDRQFGGVLNFKLELSTINNKIKEFNIVTPSSEQEIKFLSGGNQQKVALSRWLIRKPRVLILNEPTQGIDVGTKEEIYKRIRNLANEGVAIIVVFSDMIELLGMCDRIVVMREGGISKIFTSKEASEEKIVAAASGYELNNEI